MLAPRRLAPFAALAVALAAPIAAAADCDPSSRLATCVDADTLWPHAGPTPFVALGSSDTTARGQIGFGLAASYLSRPIRLHGPAAAPGGQDVVAVDELIDATFLWSIGLTDHLELDAALPTALHQTGPGVSTFRDEQPSEITRTALRDPRIGLAWALRQRARTATASGLGLALRLDVSVPAGDEGAFAGDRGWVGIPAATLDWRAGRWFAGAELGARLRKTTQLGGTQVGPQIEAMLGAGADLLGDRLGAVVEAWALPTLAEQQNLSRDAAGALQASSNGGVLLPAEWMASLRSAPLLAGDVTFQLGGGGPLPLSADQATTPRFRLAAVVRYAPLARDTDGDGVLDRDDQCVDQPEDRDGFEDDDGCPDPDNDKDGIPDVRDRCRDQAETVDGFQDDDGCPDLDDDGDGIPDEVDRCRMSPEDKDGFEDDDGCPDPDNDGDGILDAQDRCPNAAEDKDGYQDDDGCPDPDNDLDGIPDAADQCPDQPEDKDGFRDEDGCPDPDDDEDGVLDAADKCPRVPETIDGVADEDGCPEPGAHDRVTWNGDAIAMAGMTPFARGSAKLSAKMAADLAMIAQRVRGRMPGLRVIVETYGDRRGEDDANTGLAARRADAVRAALVAHGIAADAITAAVGDLGAKRPANAPPYDVQVARVRLGRAAR